VLRQVDAESRALAYLALDDQFAAMTLDHVLDNRQAQTGATRLSRATAIDPIKTLRDARQVFGCDASPVVGHRVNALSLARDAPPFRRFPLA